MVGQALPISVTSSISRRVAPMAATADVAVT